jgi:four helix bundle protein
MRDFRELKVWHKAHQVTLAVYKITKSFPREELYGLTSQMRRSAASMGSEHSGGL